MATDIQTPEQELESLTGVSLPKQAAPPSATPNYEKELESLTGVKAQPETLSPELQRLSTPLTPPPSIGNKPPVDNSWRYASPADVKAAAAPQDNPETGIDKVERLADVPLLPKKYVLGALEEGMHVPQGTLSDQDMREKGSTVQKIIAGTSAGAADAVSRLSTPKNLGILAAMEVLAPYRAVRMLVDAGFAAQMAQGAVDQFKEGMKAHKSGDTAGAAEMFTGGAISSVFAVLSGTHMGSESFHAGQDIGAKGTSLEMDQIAERNMHKSPEDMLTAIKKKQAAGQGAELTPDEQKIQDLDAARKQPQSGLQPPPAVASGETLTPPPTMPVAAPEPAQPAVKALPGKPPSQEVLSEAGLPGTVPENVREVSPKEITADPQRFQFRAGLSESGLGDINTYDPTLGGILSVWKDPADGNTYVVNGHHRLDLANRADADNVLVRYLDATDAKDARAQGALINIADGNASAIDAAKFFRDTGMTAQDLANRNVSLGKKAARDGVALASLSDGIFDRVVQGDIPQGRAVVIGQELPNMADQSAILQMIDSQGKKGVRLTDSEVRDMATFVKSKAKTTDTVATLFGDQFIEQSNAVPWAQLSDWTRKTLARDKQLFGFVAKSERARELARAGNIIDVEKSGQVADQAKIASEVYDKLLNRAGPVSKALDEGAARIARGDEVQEVRAETYAKINGAVSEALGGTEGQVRGPSETSPTGAEPAASGGTAATEVIPMGEMRLRDALKSHPTIGPAADDLIDSMGVVTQNAIGKSLDEFLRDNWADVRFEGKPGEGALGQQATYATTLAWAKRAGAVSIEPHGEQLDLFGNPEKVYMLTNKDGQQAMVLESELEKMSDEIPSLGRKWAFVKETGNAAELAPEGEATLPPEQGGLFGNINRGVEDQPGALFGPPPDDSILFQEQNPVWYNKSPNILADPDLKGSKSGPQWFSLLKDQGVSIDDMKRSGLDEFLRSKKEVTKEDLQSYVRDNQISVSEEVPIAHAGPDGSIILERSDKTALGKISFQDRDGVLKIQSFDGDPKDQNATAATARTVLTWARDHGYKEIDLSTNDELRSAVKDIAKKFGATSHEGGIFELSKEPLLQEKKGATEFLNDGKAIVYLFKNADASTFMHEFVHTLEPYLKAEDRGILDKWLDDAGFDGTRERKEALARAFEDFHYSNEAPTPEIKGVFQRIQEIMRQIYESIKDSPLVKPSAEVNDLFKRWYGFSEEAKAENDLFQMMKDVEPTPPMEISESKEEVKPVKEELPPPPAIKAEGLKPPPGDATLQAQIIPGLKEFYDQDVEPKVREMGTGLIGALEAIRDTVAPRYGVPGEALDELMRLKGDRDKQLFFMDQVLHGIKNMFEKMPKSENVEFIDRYKTGQQQKTSDLQAVADFYKKTDDETYQALREFKPSLPYKENHFRVFWKTLPMGEEAFNQGDMFPEANTSPKSGIARFFSRRPLQGTKGFMKASTLDDISTGIERGGIPVSYNPQTLFELGQADARKFLTAQAMFNNVRQIPGMAEFIKPGERIPEGMTEINDKIAKVYFKPASGEGFIEGGKWVFESGVARAMNNFLSRDLIRENFAGKKIMFVKNLSTAIELSISPFHFVFETIEAMGTQFGMGAMRSWNLGVRDLNPGQFIKGLVDMGTAPYAPIEAARLGGAVLKYVRAEALENNPELRALTGKGGWLRTLSKAEDFMNMAGGKKFMKQYPDASRMVGDLFAGGAKLAMHEDYRISTASTFLENINSGNYIGAGIRALPALNEKVMAPLFDVLIPRMKIGMWFKEYSEQLLEYKDVLDSGKMTRPELARQVWDRVENRFGEMNFDNLFWNRTFKSTMQLAFRSITWKLGNLRAATQAVGGQLSNFADPLKMLSETMQGGEFEGKRLVPKLDPNMAWILGVGATTAVLGTITAKMMTGKTPWEWVDEDEKNGMSLAQAILVETTHPRIGGYDDHGKPNRVSLPTYFRDYEHLMSSPWRYAKGSVSSLWTKIPEIWSNKDFYGKQVFNPEDPLWKKSADGLAHMVDMPFAFSNYQTTIESGGNRNAAILGFLGFTKAPREVDMSEAEKAANKIILEKMDSLPGRNEQQQAHSEARREIIHLMRHNDPEAYGKMLDYLQGGKLQHKDVGMIEKAVHESWLQSMVGGSNMDARHAMQVWSEADREERGSLMNIMILKIRRSQSLSETEKQEYVNQIMSDSKDSLPPPPGYRNTLQAPPNVP